LEPSNEVLLAGEIRSITSMHDIIN